MVQRKTSSKKEYKKSIVTFIDILGFGDLIRNSTCGVVAHVMEIIEFVSSLDKDEENSKRTVVLFSDSIIRVRPYTEEDLLAEIRSVGLIQAMLTAGGIFIRGGIAVGDAYSSGHQVFGPAVIDAYTIESKFSNYPRILVSHDIANKESMFGVQKADDGLFYVDYAYVYCSSPEFGDYDYAYEFVVSEKNHIEENLKKHTGNSYVYMKYAWSASYHNKYVDELTKEFLEYNQTTKEELKVDN